MDNETQDLDLKEPKIYEVGYLLVPTIAPEAVLDEANKLISVVEGSGGSLIASGNPEIRELAYPVSRELDRKRKYFDRAYFGWVKFQADPDKLEVIKVAYTDNQSMIRFLLINTVRNVVPAREVKRRVAKRPIRQEGESPVLPADLDKEIDALIAST